MVRILLVIAACAGAGCANGTPASPSDSLDGVWRILSIQPASQPALPAPAGAQYQVGFENGRIVARVDCNTCSGSFTTSGNTLTISAALACTRAACATASYESAVVTLLSGEHQMDRTLHNLTLSSSRGTISLQR